MRVAAGEHNDKELKPKQQQTCIRSTRNPEHKYTYSIITNGLVRQTTIVSRQHRQTHDRLTAEDLALNLNPVPRQARVLAKSFQLEEYDEAL
jgi:hypothetical protein